jgi:hypothetical protein
VGVERRTDVDTEVLGEREALRKGGGRDFEDEKTEVKRHRDKIVLVAFDRQTHHGRVGEGVLVPELGDWHGGRAFMSELEKTRRNQRDKKKTQTHNIRMRGEASP